MEKIQEKSFLSAAALKRIAVVTMFLDHFAVAILELGLDKGRTGPYKVLRSIGRIAFPIYVFLLVEGVRHTSSKKRYLKRLFLFALLSEIPFDLALYGEVYYKYHNNVMFTLFLGALMVVLIEKIREGMGELGRFSFYLVAILVALAFAFLAERLAVDYGALGIFAIFLFYLAGEGRLSRFIRGEVAFFFEFPSLVHLANVLILFYNGKRGRQNKYFFYAFYPCHLLFLYFLRLTLPYWV